MRFFGGDWLVDSAVHSYVSNAVPSSIHGPFFSFLHLAFAMYRSCVDFRMITHESLFSFSPIVIWAWLKFWHTPNHLTYLDGSIWSFGSLIHVVPNQCDFCMLFLFQISLVYYILHLPILKDLVLLCRRQSTSTFEKVHFSACKVFLESLVLEDRNYIIKLICSCPFFPRLLC